MLKHFSRTSLIALSKAAWARRLVTRSKMGWRAASRFVAGETVEEAIQAIGALNERGIFATLDFLGESVQKPEDARAATAEILHALEAIHRTEVLANVSIKLSQLGLGLGIAECQENLSQILQSAEALHLFVRIDMEGSDYTESTLAVWRWARQQGFTQVGIVIQAYLFRSEADIREIMEMDGRVRLCKGAYDEPAQIAFPLKKDVDANYDLLAERLIEKTGQAGPLAAEPNGKTPPVLAAATHDDQRIEAVKTALQRFGLDQKAVEFQMLYGVRRELQERLVSQGYAVRVYVPYGTQWYPYFMRRLAERPENIWFFLSNYLRK